MFNNFLSQINILNKFVQDNNDMVKCKKYYTFLME